KPAAWQPRISKKATELLLRSAHQCSTVSRCYLFRSRPRSAPRPSMSMGGKESFFPPPPKTVQLRPFPATCAAAPSRTVSMVRAAQEIRRHPNKSPGARSVRHSRGTGARLVARRYDVRGAGSGRLSDCSFWHRTTETTLPSTLRERNHHRRLCADGTRSRLG